jgi:hypothetical protein
MEVGAPGAFNLAALADAPPSGDGSKMLFGKLEVS